MQVTKICWNKKGLNKMNFVQSSQNQKVKLRNSADKQEKPLTIATG